MVVQSAEKKTQGHHYHGLILKYRFSQQILQNLRRWAFNQEENYYVKLWKLRIFSSSLGTRRKDCDRQVEDLCELFQYCERICRNLTTLLVRFPGKHL